MFLGYLFFCACKHACIPEWRHSDSQLLSTFSLCSVSVLSGGC